MPGYVVTSSHDTLTGFIQRFKETKPGESLHFKQALVDFPEQVARFEQIKSFAYTGSKISTPIKPKTKTKLFLPNAGVVSSDHLIIQDQLLNSIKDINTDSVKKKIIVREVITGRVSLYQGLDENQNEKYYLQKDNSDLLALSEINYLGMLKITLPDCPALAFDQQEARSEYNLTLSSLTQIILTYNACAHPAIFQTYNNFASARKMHWSGGLKAGAGVSQVKYTVGVSKELAQSPSQNNTEAYSSKMSFAGGVYGQLKLGRRFSLRPELLLVKKGGTVEKEIYTGTPSFYHDYDNRTFSFSYLQVPVIIQYAFSLPFKPYVTAGIIAGKELSRSLTIDYYREQDNQPRRSLPNPKEIDFDDSEIGGLLGIGVHIPVTNKNILLLELRHEITRLPRYSVGVLNVSTWQIQTGIRIF